MSDESVDEGASETREWLVEGRVQGVGFRFATRRRAEALGVRGFAENLPDGRVRVVGAGTAEALRAFGEWLRRGPPGARVDALEERLGEFPATGPPGRRRFTTH